METNMNLGRDKVPWSQDVWNRIDPAVPAEGRRSKVTSKFIPIRFSYRLLDF